MLFVSTLAVCWRRRSWKLVRPHRCCSSIVARSTALARSSRFNQSHWSSVPMLSNLPATCPKLANANYEAAVQDEIQSYHNEYERIIATEPDSLERRRKIREYSRSIPMRAETDWPLDVIYEDDEILVVNKPQSVIMNPCHRWLGGSMLNRALGHVMSGGKIDQPVMYLYLDQPQPVRMVHRLDVLTSGVVLYAKKDECLRKIQEAFRHRTVLKEYLALLVLRDGAGNVLAKEGSEVSVDASIGRDPENKEKRKICDVGHEHGDHGTAKKRAAMQKGTRKQAKIAFSRSSEEENSDEDSGSNSLPNWLSEPPRPATTIITTLRVSPDAQYALVRCKPLSGRTHQIRLHCAHLNAPILNDPLYWPEFQQVITELEESNAGFDGSSCKLRLHAEKLTIPETVGSSPVRQFVARVPAAFLHDLVRLKLTNLE